MSRAQENLNKAMALHYEQCGRNLRLFFRAAWRVLEPETELLVNWHHDLLDEYLTAVKSGEIKRLIINVAPRTTKSLKTTVSFPCWWWTSEPGRRFLFGSYSDNLATKHSVLRRALIESDWYRAGFSHNVQLIHGSNMKTEFANTATGEMKSCGIKGSVTGSGADCIVIDDAHNPRGAESELERDSICQNFDLAWSSRLNDKKTGRIVVIMQRLHERDLTGHLLSKELGYEHVKIPTIADKKTVIVFPVSGREVVREEGALLHPEREGPEQIEQAKKDLGSYGFAGQHQQNPVPREGAIIKHSWLSKFYKELPSKFDASVQSWDLTFKGTRKSDFVVGITVGRLGGDFYLFPMRVRSQLNFPETIAAFRSYSSANPTVIKKIVEAKANGAALVDSLSREITGIVPYEPRGTKEERLSAVSPILEAGNFYLPDPTIAPWVHEYIDEMTSFPRAPNDDYVDATTQALSELSKRRTLDWSPVSMVKTSKWGGF